MSSRNLNKEKLREDNLPLERCDIRSLSQEHQQRFVDAVKTMMIEEKSLNENGKIWSIYSKVAAIHGDQCAHGNESFPGWHRAYLAEFEYLLQKADVQNGNREKFESPISLCYWDQTDLNYFDSEPLPKIILEQFDRFPEHFGIELNRGSIEDIKQNLMRSRVVDNAYESLNAFEHWQHASTKQRGISLETPHNSVHVALGYPMGEVPFAAFDPMFFLHHCNVDRIYESYLNYNTDSAKEFYLNQSQNEFLGKLNLQNEKLEPFVNRENKTSFMPKDTFDIKKLGYTYDKLLKKRPQRLQAQPILAHFRNIDIMEMKNKTYQLHVFVCKKENEGSFKVDKSLSKTDQASMPEYAGMGAIFGRGKGCENCKRRDVFQVHVNIEEALSRLDIFWREAALKVVCVETCSHEMKVVDIEETPVPKPTIIGPAFKSQTQQIGVETQNDSDEVKVIQEYMLKYGMLKSGEFSEGQFDEKTKIAIEKLQKQAGKLVDGVVGTETKAVLFASRCKNADPEEEKNNASHEDLLKEITPLTTKENSVIKYQVGAGPVKLDREQYVNEIQLALDIWAKKIGITFTQIDKKEEAQLKIKCSLKWMNDNLESFAFDGRGQTLARAKYGKSITLDRSEVWKLYTNRTKDPAKHNEFYVHSVIAHELGHYLGLDHSLEHDDVMAPFYKADIIDLSQNDIRRIQKIYVVEN